MRTALKKMGYTEARPGRWAKPVGFHLFTFDEKTNEWTNWFLPGNSDDPAVWNTNIPGPVEQYGTLDRQIREWEAWTRINILASARADFTMRVL